MTTQHELRSTPNIYPTCDPESDQQRRQEMGQLQSEGYHIETAASVDAAYERPDKIRQVYDYLRVRDMMLDKRRAEFRARNVGRAVLGKVFPHIARKQAKSEDAFLEPYRTELLFGPEETNSQAWHDQRGRALALSTITYAHELATSSDSSGAYMTMSGPIDASLFEYEFPSSVEGFGGASVREAMIRSQVAYSGKKSEVAARWVDKALVKTRAFVEAPVSNAFKEVVQYCYDSQGIRERKEVVNAKISEHMAAQVKEGRSAEDMLVMSFGCGTALPMLEAMLDAKQAYGAAPTLVLLDQDPLALAAAAVMAHNMGLEESIEIHCKKLFSALGKPLNLQDVLKGRSLDIAEDSGLREYLPDRTYEQLTRETWKNIRESGLMITGNMNSHRPQAEFLHGLMGWLPRVQMRSIREGLHRHEAAGIPHGNTQVTLTKSGVYSIFHSNKPGI